jgi:hypothetical protein
MDKPEKNKIRSNKRLKIFFINKTIEIHGKKL